METLGLPELLCDTEAELEYTDLLALIVAGTDLEKLGETLGNVDLEVRPLGLKTGLADLLENSL